MDGNQFMLMVPIGGIAGLFMKSVFNNQRNKLITNLKLLQYEK